LVQEPARVAEKAEEADPEERRAPSGDILLRGCKGTGDLR
jgi:hypothetical protein